MFSKFRNDVSGGLPSVEFALISPAIILISFCLIQFMLLAQAKIVIKGAANAAARSAFVNYCEPIGLQSLSENIAGTVLQSLFDGCEDDPEKPKTAAKLALIPISSSNGKSKSRQGSCDFPQALIQLMQKDAVRTNLKEALENKACYAFEPDNTTVTIEWQSQLGPIDLPITLTHGPPPITAWVSFKIPVLAPVRMIFGRGQRGDGTRYIELSAKASVI